MSSAQKPAPTIQAAEELLASLAGVVSAHVVADVGGRIVEVHILCTPDLHPKQVVRNVESALTAGLGLAIDRRVVSVAQIRASTGFNGHPSIVHQRTGDDDEASDELSTTADDDRPDHAPRSAPAVRRLEFVRFQARRDEERCTCEVTLRDGRRELVGTGSAADTTAGRAEAAARAVFHGLVQARPELRLELVAATLSAARGRSYVIVSAHTLLERTTVPLVGAAPLYRSPEEAAILAALQATNRWSA